VTAVPAGVGTSWGSWVDGRWTTRPAAADGPGLGGGGGSRPQPDRDRHPQREQRQRPAVHMPTGLSWWHGFFVLSSLHINNLGIASGGRP